MLRSYALTPALVPGVLYLCAVAAKLTSDANAASAFLFHDENYYRLAALGFSRGDAGEILKLPYPPLYPLVITPAFFFGDSWYEWILRINAVVASLTVFPVWVIARRFLPVIPATLCAAIAVLLPYNFVYPRMVMSENLFFPVFLLSLLMLLVTPRPGAERFQTVVLGFVWALCLLTRHIFVSILPLLVCFWYLQPRFATATLQPDWKRVRLSLLAWLALGFVVTYAPWILFNVLSGVSVLHAVGIGIPFDLIDAKHVTNDELQSSLLGWAGTYAATACLLYAPYIAVVGQWRVCRRSWLFSEPTFLIIIVLTTTFMLALTAFTVLWKYYADRWAESYIEERYLIYFLPVLPILAAIAFRRVKESHSSGRHLIVIASIAVMSVVASYGLVIDSALWPQHPFSSNVQSSAQLLAFHAPLGPVGSSLLLIVVATAIGLTMTVSRFPNLAFGMWFASVFGFYIVSDRVATEAMDALQSSAGLGRVIAGALQSSGPTELAAAPVQIQLDQAVKDAPTDLDRIINFWGIPDGTFSVSQTTAHDLVRPQGLLISHSLFSNPIAEYRSSGSTYYVYRQPISNASQVRIESVNPSSVRVGAKFNVQANGASAGWIVSQNATSAAVVVFGGKFVDTVVSNPALVTFVVPADVVEVPGSYAVYLLDTQTGAKSNMLPFDVTP